MKNIIEKSAKKHVCSSATAITETGNHAVFDLSLMLSSARSEERINRAAVFAARLEAIASFITKQELTGIEAAEALRDEAARIQNDAGDSH